MILDCKARAGWRWGLSRTLILSRGRLSQGRAQSWGPLLAPEGHSSSWEEERKLLFVPKTWVGFEEMKAGCFAFWRKCASTSTTTWRQMCSCDEGFCRARHFQAAFKMSISGVWNHSGCHSWVTLGLSRGVFREWGRCWHQSALVCETQSITNNIFFKESYLLSCIFKLLFSMFVWYAQEEQRKACGLEPHFSDSTMHTCVHTHSHLESY